MAEEVGRDDRPPQQPPTGDPNVEPKETLAAVSDASIRRETIIVGATLIAVSLAIAFEAWRLAQANGLKPSGPATVPLAVAGGLIIFSVLFLVEAWRKSDPHLDSYLRMERANTHLFTVAKVLVILVTYAAVVASLGYLLATAGLFAVVSRTLGSRRLLWDIGIGICLAAAAYLGFTLLLGVRLPAGIMGGI